jgi:hypothetical protein
LLADAALRVFICGIQNDQKDPFQRLHQHIDKISEIFVAEYVPVPVNDISYPVIVVTDNTV